MSAKQVRYERVNIDDIDTSSDDDDYGDLFANERGRIVGNGRRSKLIPTRKGTKPKSMCYRGLCAVLFVLVVLLLLAGVALYLDPEDGLQMFTPKFQETNTTSLIAEETLSNVTEKISVSEDSFDEGLVNSTLSDSIKTTLETMVTNNSDANVSDIKETIYPTSFDQWSTLSSSSSSYRLK